VISMGRGLTGSSNRTRFSNGDSDIIVGCELGCIFSNGTSTVENRSGGSLMNFGF
jgi:hypothetical protein